MRYRLVPPPIEANADSIGDFQLVDLSREFYGSGVGQYIHITDLRRRGWFVAVVSSPETDAPGTIRVHNFSKNIYVKASNGYWYCDNDPATSDSAAIRNTSLDAPV